MINNAVNHKEIMVNPILPTELQWYMRNFVLDLMKSTPEFLFFHFCFNLFIFILQNLYLCIFIFTSYNNNNNNYDNN